MQGFASFDVHYWTTPNGGKIGVSLEEAELPYKIIPVNIGTGEQFKPVARQRMTDGEILGDLQNLRVPLEHPDGGRNR